jgi:hypothetical protein
MKINKYLILIISVIILFILSGGFYFFIKGRMINFNEISCSSCVSLQNSEVQKEAPQKVKTAGEKTFKEMIGFGAVATAEGSATKYFNWKPKNPCPGLEGCYLKKIEAKATFINTGQSSISSEKGAGYIQIANSEKSNCSNPSQASFSYYLAYSPVIYGGEAKHLLTCNGAVPSNTCNLSKSDGFNESSNCFSLKLFAQNKNNSAVNFATHLVYLKYTWAWQTANQDEPQ